jgi:RNA polymerase sigma-70 factor, ECF subfamily
LVIDAKLVERLYVEANGAPLGVARHRFGEALQASAERALGSAGADHRAVERYLQGLHLEDLALACACAAGDDSAWERFILEQRPLLYRAADALDPAGGARDLADSLYADLFGMRERAGERQSLFRYFHGRSSLATWLRSVLAQRYVDRLRVDRRIDTLPDDDSPAAIAAVQPAPDPDRDRHVDIIQAALDRALANLPARDRLRLACYYAQEMTLAQTGRLLGEHEATSSRQLARTRRAIRADVEQQLRTDKGMSDAEIAHCFECVTEDIGPLDLRSALEPELARKKLAVDRSS